jgi:MerR family copper efflux transcriptional regulator
VTAASLGEPPSRLLTWPSGARFTLGDMGRHGLRAGEVAARSGVSRKALRLYEAMGILSPPGRTEAGYRVYGDDVLALLGFVTQARRLGFSLAEIRAIAAIRRSGPLPCPHVQDLVRLKVAALDRTLRELTATRRALRAMLASWPSPRSRVAAVCPHIEEGR